MELAPGVSLGPYEVQGRLGRGGMGEVYSARDSRLDRPVAIKVLPADVAEDPERRKRLLREARAAASLAHPSICTLYEVGEHDGRAFIAMEHIPGSTLAELLRPNGLPVETTLRYGMQIAGALAYAHDHGVVHRDLKCTNIMVTPEGLAKVVDFGLARRRQPDDLQELTQSRDRITAKGSVVGTLTYMAPEVLAGEQADARCDIWALGVVLYAMVSGGLPFAGRTPFELTASILRETPSPLPSSVQPGLRAIVRRCLAKDVSVRYQRAGEVGAALESANEDLALGEGLTAPASRAQAAVAEMTDESTLAFDSLAPLAPTGDGKMAGSSSTVEIQTLNRIAGALKPIVTGAKIVAAISVGLVVLGFLGLVTSATFDLALHVPLEASAFDYVIFGLRAVIPTVVLMLIDMAVIAVFYGLVQLVTWVTVKARHREDGAQPGRGMLKFVQGRLEAAGSRVTVSWLLALSAVGLGTVVAVSWPILRTIDRLVETPTALPVDTLALSPSSHSYHFLVSWIAATTILVLGAGWLLGLSMLERQGKTGALLTLMRVAALVTVLVVTALTVVPWRILWDCDRERVALDGQSAFVVTEQRERLFLYVPRGAERFVEVSSNDARVEKMRDATRGNIFIQP